MTGSTNDDLLAGLEGGEKTVLESLRGLSFVGTPLRFEHLERLLGSRSDLVMEWTIGAAGYVDDDRVAALVFEHWHSKYQLDVALCLGRRRETRYTPELVELLTRRVGALEGRRWQFVAVALLAMADPACIPEVRRMLRTCLREQVWSLTEILRAASGESRLVDPVGPDGKFDVQNLRLAWLDETPATPGVVELELASERRAQMLLCGTEQVRLGYPMPSTAGNWPRWERAIYVNDEILYNANSGCPTCETYLARTGEAWPRRAADRVGDALESVGGLSAELLKELEPALRPLPSGRYSVALLELELERVDEADAARSWYARRGEYRVSRSSGEDAAEGDFEPFVTWPKTSHYQVPGVLDLEVPTGLTVLPSQALENLDETTVSEKLALVRGGHRAAALALGWLEHRDIAMECEEAAMQIVLLDGHHTVEAYCRAGRRARLIVFFPWTFSFVPPLREALDELLRDS